jgi:hypothetical protein
MSSVQPLEMPAHSILLPAVPTKPLVLRVAILIEIPPHILRVLYPTRVSSFVLQSTASKSIALYRYNYIITA